MNRRQARKHVDANLLTSLVILCICVATLVLVLVYGMTPQ